MLNYVVNVQVGFVNRYETIQVKVNKVNDVNHAKSVAIIKVEKMVKDYTSMSVGHKDVALIQ